MILTSLRTKLILKMVLCNFPMFPMYYFRILAIIIPNMGQQSVKLSLHIRVVLDPQACAAVDMVYDLCYLGTFCNL